MPWHHAWHKLSTEQRHEMVNFGGQVRGQGHMRPTIDLEAWWKHRSRPLGRVAFLVLQYLC